MPSTTKSLVLLHPASDGLNKKSLGLITETSSPNNAPNKISNDLSVPFEE